MASWTQNQIEALIDSYELHPCLYAVKHKDYHNKYKRNMALEEIVKKLNMLRPGTTIQDINKKIQGLRNTYSVERKKVLEATRSGMGEDEVYHPSLWYYSKIAFLNDHLQIRASKSTFIISDS